MRSSFLVTLVCTLSLAMFGVGTNGEESLTVRGIGSPVDKVAVVSDVSEAEHGRSLRRRRKRRRKAPRVEEMPELCERIRSLPRKSTFTSCLEQRTPTNKTQLCDSYNDPFEEYETKRENCQRDERCQWYGPPGTGKDYHRCVVNPCFRINNGRCTIQHTGGRCVWWTKAQNRKFFGRNYPGCYSSPCHHPIDNTERGCKENNVLVPHRYRNAEDPERFAEPSPFQCTFCRGGVGCVNTKLESLAQCWNVGNSRACSSCNSPLGRGCRSRKCDQACCGNDEYCQCVPRTDSGLDIVIP